MWLTLLRTVIFFGYADSEVVVCVALWRGRGFEDDVILVIICDF